MPTKLRSPGFAIVLFCGIGMLAAAAQGQMIDRTQAPNAANDGIAKSLAEQIGAGRVPAGPRHSGRRDQKAQWRPRALARKTAICPRVSGALGQKFTSLHPAVMSEALSASIHWKKG